MAERICPVCGCVIEGTGYEKGGVTYCCEPCASGNGACECQCCYVAGEEEDIDFWSRALEETGDIALEV